MGIQRFVGLAFSIGLLLLTLFVFLKPQIDYQQEQTIDLVNIIQTEVAIDPIQVAEVQDEKLTTDLSEDSVKISLTNSKNLTAIDIKKSDFDLFAYRIGIFRSKENASALIKKLDEGGFNSYTELFGVNKDSIAVYVGPVHNKSDINEELILKVSETPKGEIVRWKF
jgi:cell division septation protein DedD